MASASNANLFSDDDEEYLMFEDDQLPSKSFPRFEEVRRNGKLCDVTLIINGDQRLSAHKIVLAATIPYFYAMFTSDMVESNQKEISMQVFEALIFWVRKDEENRRRNIARLLTCVRLPLLKPQYITDHVASEELIKNSIECRDLVDEAKDYHLMPERRPLMQSFRTKPRCCNDILGHIYAVGGLTNNGDSLSTVERYDTMTNRWVTMEPMSTLRSRVGVAVMHGKMYAIGGFNGHERLQTVELFDPESKSWREVCSLNKKRSALAAAVVGDRLYVCGGYDGATSLASVEYYDLPSNKWFLMDDMTKQRSAAGVTIFDGKIYVLGGHDGSSIFNTVEYFDPETGKWTQVKSMLSRRCRLGAATLNGEIYACGGYDGSQFLRTVEKYNPETDEWKLVSSMNVKRSRVALVSNCGKLYAVGGYDGISNLSSMEIYDPSYNVWRFGASMMAHEGGVGVGVIPVDSMTIV
uniref:BTB domain-containing protein n=1 Tax=Romanomermis culicivorax TaxID=13658 RepID=A0A915KP29_ROMCU